MRRQNIGRRTRNASRVHNLRNSEPEEERRQRLEANKMRVSQARSTTTPEESVPSTSVERRQNAQPNVSITYERLAFRYDPTVDYAGDKSVDFRTMNNICQYCSTLRFQLKPTGIMSIRVTLQNDISAEVFSKALLDIGNGRIPVDPSLLASFCLHQIFVNPKHQKNN